MRSSAISPAWRIEAEALLERLVAEHRPGHALAREFSTDAGLYRLDLERVWRRGWLFAGHSCQIERPGDYLVFDVDDDSIIVIRGDDGVVRAMHNTCRHRGMRVCREESGTARLLVCPYHQWAYARSGELLACGGMDKDGDLDKKDFGLQQAHAREVEGLVFVSMASEPPSFEPAAAELSPMLRPQGLGRARVAAVRNYVVRSNWKLVWENNRECWHCDANHPEYVQANFDSAPVDDARVRQKVETIAAGLADRLRVHGMGVNHPAPGLYRFPSRECWWSVNRSPLTPGWVTESLDGQPVAPLMGEYRVQDVGTLRTRTMPNFWNHASSDHAVSTRLAPAGVDRTLAQVTWLVRRDAVETRDYELDRLLPFWQRTSEQDWDLCERNQAGVRSSAFRPGPYSSKREYNVIAYIEWYLDRMGAR